VGWILKNNIEKESTIVFNKRITDRLIKHCILFLLQAIIAFVFVLPYPCTSFMSPVLAHDALHRYLSSLQNVQMTSYKWLKDTSTAFTLGVCDLGFRFNFLEASLFPVYPILDWNCFRLMFMVPYILVIIYVRLLFALYILGFICILYYTNLLLYMMGVIIAPILKNTNCRVQP
jgi:hypothetical protein